tara:strand:- start:270 stop:671 length:402 start_codon:yes stop_codon:yes gene_type:complete
MSNKKDIASAKKTIKTAKKGSAAYIEAKGILSGDNPEKREYRKTTRKNSSKRTNPYKDVIGLTGSVMQAFPETTMNMEDAVGFSKIYESNMKSRGKKSLKKIDEDYSGTSKTAKKAKGGKVSSGYKCSHNRLY